MTVDQQDESHWCWAAVAISIRKFLNPGVSTLPSGAPLSQGNIATEVLVRDRQVGVGVDCEHTPGFCNRAARLGTALDVTGNFDSAYANSYFPFDSVREFVDAELPLAVRVAWWGGGAHYLVIDGYRVLTNGGQQVHVADPRYGESLWFYDGFRTDYRGAGLWQDTISVRKAEI